MSRFFLIGLAEHRTPVDAFDFVTVVVQTFKLLVESV